MNSIRLKIFNHLLERLRTHSLKPDMRIPTEMELAEQFGTNRMNAYMAVKELERRGVVTRNRRKGTYVRRGLPERDLSILLNQPASRIHLLCSLKIAKKIHWDESTISALEQELNEKGYQLSCREPPEPLSRNELKRVFADMTKENSAGLLLLLNRSEKEFFAENLDLLLAHPPPVYFLNRGESPVELGPFHSVRFDQLGEGMLVGKCLAKRGVRSVVFLHPFPNVNSEYWAAERCKGLDIGMNMGVDGAGADASVEVVKDSDSAALCERIRSKPGATTIVASNDEEAASFIEKARGFSLTPPHDFQIIGFDDNPRFRQYNLTTVSPPLEEIGRLFGKMICERCWATASSHTVAIRVASRIIERETCRLDAAPAVPSGSNPI